MATITKTVTYDEWLKMPEVRVGIEEVVNGEIRLMPPPKYIHTQIVHALRKSLERQLDEATIVVYDTQFGIVIRLDPLTSRVPDLGVFRKDAIMVIDNYIHSAPDLAVEILS